MRNTAAGQDLLSRVYVYRLQGWKACDLGRNRYGCIDAAGNIVKLQVMQADSQLNGHGNCFLSGSAGSFSKEDSTHADNRSYGAQ